MDPLTSTVNAAGTSVDLAVSYAEDAKNTHNSAKNMQREGEAKRQAMEIKATQGMADQTQNQLRDIGASQAQVLAGTQ
ncbi:hypothetical protein [uncultured Roseibium sp.]|uniref:hypothetical protein n=1 Tax=uncultured Roseibium sp. TaxID=1936171 RepID=UPI00261D0ED6|nr:hypothetical protein [uncultured Roseibium sp.]